MTPAERAARTGSDDHLHVLMPSMGYACGGNCLTKKGRSTTGWLDHWERVTCPDCRQFDPAEVWRASRRMQGHDIDACDCDLCRSGRRMPNAEPRDLFDLL